MSHAPRFITSRPRVRFDYRRRRRGSKIGISLIYRYSFRCPRLISTTQGDVVFSPTLQTRQLKTVRHRHFTVSPSSSPPRSRFCAEIFKRPWQRFRNGKHPPPSSSLFLARRARATLDRMSGSPLRSPYGSKSPRPRCQSTAGSNGSASPPMTGRERLAIQFLAGQSPSRPRTSSIGSGSSGTPSVPTVPAGYTRQRVASTYAPGATASGGRARSFVPTPSALGPGTGASPGYAIQASPPDTRGR